jgi:hypothetical protein
MFGVGMLEEWRVEHPTLGRGYLECAYAPTIELLGYLEANGFAQLPQVVVATSCARSPRTSMECHAIG